MKKSIFLFFTISFFNFLYANTESIQDGYVKISQKEVDFINKTQIRVITSNTWAPFNMYNEDDELSGIAIDFWNLIKKKANLKATIKLAKSWNDVLKKIEKRQADITLATTFDKKKLNYAIFSTPYISFPIAFATLYDKRFIPDGSFLEGLNVAVGENYSAYIIMKEKFPKINFVQIKNTKEALKLLSAGEVDAVIDILPVIAHLISINGYSNLKIAGTSKEEVQISFMIRKDYKELQQTINRHIYLLTPEEKNNIIREWITVKFDKRFIDKNILINISILLLSFIAFYIYKQRNLAKHKEELEFLSNTDSLTGLKNRRKIDKILNEQKNKKFSIILMDIDHFKQINDNFGHLIGDEILIEVAKLLKHNVNANDILGRWGGEEFLIICKNTSIQEAKSLANRIKTLLENKEFKLCKITASFGISKAENNLELKDILANADHALYKAKKNGRNQIVLWEN